MTANLRSFLILLLMLTLPINGMAQLLMPVTSSVHQPMADMDGMSGINGMDDTDQDCREGQDQGPTSLCKSGQECKTSSLVQIAVAKADLIPAAKPVTTPYNDQIPSRLLDAVWHPPRV